MAFFALTPFALIPCADVRLLLKGRFSLEALEANPEVLWEEISLHLTRQRQLSQTEPELELMAG
jgi:hypothetical protein